MIGNERGQALIETAVMALTLAPIIGMFLVFTDAMQTRQKLLLAAWKGAELYSSGCLAPDQVDAQVMDYLTRTAPALSPDRIQFVKGSAPLRGSFLYQLDRYTVRYKSKPAWSRLLGWPETLEESCFIRHAPHYWDPFMEHIPGIPPLKGPAYPWKNGNA